MQFPGQVMHFVMAVMARSPLAPPPGCCSVMVNAGLNEQVRAANDEKIDGLDTIIRGGTVATASDTFACDVGIRDGRIAALGETLGGAAEIVDATGKLSAWRHRQPCASLSQPSGPGIVMADDFESGTRAAAFGGNSDGAALRHAAEGRVAARGRRSIITPRPTAIATSTSRSI